MKRYCLTLDLKDDPKLIAEYEAYHRDVWPEIKESISTSGITSMEIYRHSNHLFMIIDTSDDFSFEKKAEMDGTNTKVREWEELMWKFQQPVRDANPGQKWVLMDKIFDL